MVPRPFQCSGALTFWLSSMTAGVFWVPHRQPDSVYQLTAPSAEAASDSSANNTNAVSYRIYQGLLKMAPSASGNPVGTGIRRVHSFGFQSWHVELQEPDQVCFLRAQNGNQAFNNSKKTLVLSLSPDLSWLCDLCFFFLSFTLK